MKKLKSKVFLFNYLVLTFCLITIITIFNVQKYFEVKKKIENSLKDIKENNLRAQNNDRKDEPFEKIVSDTTSFYFKGKKYDWTFYLDVFNNEIVGLDVRETMYGNGILNHKKAVENMLNNKIKRGYKDLDTIVHIFIPQYHLKIYLIPIT